MGQNSQNRPITTVSAWKIENPGFLKNKAKKNYPPLPFFDPWVGLKDPKKFRYGVEILFRYLDFTAIGHIPIYSLFIEFAPHTENFWDPLHEPMGRKMGGVVIFFGLIF